METLDVIPNELPTLDVIDSPAKVEPPKTSILDTAKNTPPG